ncbi:DMT family transporter [Falsiroseomonas oryziterrae]|uniref:DMT family transporter n=1 Tax=Falsiroseomonas oryziterrae TaxID=2911368 RepID=UPI001F2E61EA|nr:DMT family transporter [Roseomonas sp. NPKOSM-4]
MALAYFQLALSMALVGANVAVAKLLAESLPVALILGLRCLLAVIVLWPIARAMEGRLGIGRVVGWNLALQALFGTLLYNLALLAGLRLTTALEAGLILATLPAVVAVGGALWLREKLPARQWAAVALAAFGMAALVLARVAADGHGSALGNLLVFLGVCGEAMYVLLARRIAGQVPVVTATFWMQVFSFLMLVPLCLPVLGGIAALAAPEVSALLVFHSLTSSVICLLLWYAGMKRAPAGIAGVFTAFLPATAAAVAVGLLGEPFTAVHAAGFVLLTGSLLLATWPARR